MRTQEICSLFNCLLNCYVLLSQHSCPHKSAVLMPVYSTTVTTRVSRHVHVYEAVLSTCNGHSVQQLFTRGGVCTCMCVFLALTHSPVTESHSVKLTTTWDYILFRMWSHFFLIFVRKLTRDIDFKGRC